MKTTARWLTWVVGVLCLASCTLAAGGQATHAAPARSATASKQAAKPAQPADPSAAQPQNQESPNAAIGGELAETSREAAGEETHEENANFKYSTVVKKLGHLIGLSPRAMYAVSIVVNFVLLGLFFYMLLRARLPQMFRERTAAIQKGIREAQAASAEAGRRLTDIEARLARLDAEVSEIRASAEQEAGAEEERIRKAAEEDKQKIVQGAEAEIAAIARNARQGLKSYAASLAVDLASHNIHVDAPTDQELVREFVDQLGRDGK